MQKTRTASEEFRAFDRAMMTILWADPKAVKEAMEKEAQAQAAKRKAKGERKRGRRKEQQSGVA